MAQRLMKLLDRFNEAGVIFSLTVMMVSVLIQVFARFFLDSAPSWTEEMARIFFVFSVAFGAGLAVKEGAYIFLDSVIHWFNPGMRSMINTTGKLIVLLVAIVMLAYSFKFVAIGTLETSPAMNINMGYVFTSMPIMAGMISVYTLLSIKHKDKSPA